MAVAAFIKKFLPSNRSVLTHVRMPPKQWLDWAHERSKYSPDVWQIGQTEHQALFVCDTLMQGKKHHDAIQDTSELIGDAFTMRPFQMYNKNDGKDEYAVVIGVSDKEAMTSIQVPGWMDVKQGTPARIKGELYKINTDTLFELDSRCKNTVEFVRVKMVIDVPYCPIGMADGKVGQYNKFVWAWMYIGVPSYWNPLIDAGYTFKSVNIYQSPREFLSGPYYYYNQHTIEGDGS